MKVFLTAALMLAFGMQTYAADSNTGLQYADVTKMELDPNLPEPFARTQVAQVMIDNNDQAATLMFLMAEDEGIEVTFPIVSDMTDACSNRTVIGAPPAGSTPYYKDFEIKIVDYSANTCTNIQPLAQTVATLKSYEVRHKTTTLSTLLAGKLKTGKIEE